MAGYIIATLVAVVAGVAIACWRAAERDRKRLAIRCTHLTGTNAKLRGDLSRLSAVNGELRRDNADLEGRLLGDLTCEPSLTEAVYADLAELPLTYPGDPR